MRTLTDIALEQERLEKSSHLYWDRKKGGEITA